jgi:hypothetical protein
MKRKGEAMKMGPCDRCGATAENRCICSALAEDHQRFQSGRKLERWRDSQDNDSERLALLAEFFMYCNFHGMMLSSSCNADSGTAPSQQDCLQAEARVREISRHVFGYDIFDPLDTDSASRVRP